jgi:hypothetical protein
MLAQRETPEFAELDGVRAGNRTLHQSRRIPLVPALWPRFRDVVCSGLSGAARSRLIPGLKIRTPGNNRTGRAWQCVLEHVLQMANDERIQLLRLLHSGHCLK